MGAKAMTWRAGAALALLALAGMVAVVGPLAAREGDAPQAGDPLAEAFAALVTDSAALLVPASGRAGDELDFAVELAADVSQPVAYFAEGKRAVISGGLLQALPDVEAWFALLARLEAMHEAAAPDAKRKRFTVRAVPPADALYRGGTNDPNQQIVRRSTEAAIETLRRKRLAVMTPEEWLEEQRRIDGEAIEILRRLGLGADALLRLYDAVRAAGGVTLESADPSWREPMAQHLAWLKTHAGPPRPAPEAVSALAPRLGAVQEALRSPRP